MKEAIITQLGQEYPWKDRLHWFGTIDSTNTQAKRMAAEGAPHGTVLIAGCQTGGRGRMGRQFHSPAGTGIYLSLILRPGCPPRQLMHLTCAAAVAACDGVEAAIGIRPGIKWINDLVWQGKKLAGILTELSIAPGTGLVDYAVVGIGINCTQAPGDFPPEIRDIACSAAMAISRPVSISRLAASILTELEKMSANLPEKAPTMARYRTGCVTLGREVSVIRAGQIRHGRALDIDEDGALLVAFADGRTEAVSSGEVSIRAPGGYV